MCVWLLTAATRVRNMSWISFSEDTLMGVTLSEVTKVPFSSDCHLYWHTVD